MDVMLVQTVVVIVTSNVELQNERRLFYAFKARGRKWQGYE